MNVNQPGDVSPSLGPQATTPSTGCVVCGLDQNANQILLCDGCDAEYHTYCLAPPLKEIPEDDFYCKSCTDAKIHKAARPDAGAASSLPGGLASGATQAGFAVQDENGRMVPIRPEDVRESKYKGVLKLLHKGAKKPFVARINKDDKYVQLGLYNSEIEAAHGFDKAAIQHFGRAAKLNFPHLHEGFVRAGVTSTVASSSAASLGGQVRAAASQSIAASPSVPSSSIYSPGFGTPGRGRGRGRGRGAGRGSRGGAAAGGGGRGKRRLEDDSPQRDGSDNVAVNGSAVKRRKAHVVATNNELPVANGPKFMGVQVFRGYSHAQIIVNGKAVNLGTFPTAVDAAVAYDKAALKYFGGDIGAKDALHDRVVLNFPNNRAELLKQLIQESMHQKVRQAGGSLVTGASSSSSHSANRSMQSAKHNLSIKKLENWLLKLQRSVKLVEAAHRVQWGGLPLVKHEDQGEESEETPQDVKLELLAGAGPMIKTNFTKKQQRLRTSALQIETAVKLMVEELKIYADDTPVDAAFHPAPKSHVLLDLMSTSRFLKLCSTINELAHFNATAAEIENQSLHDGSTSDESLEALVQTVVDYRTRLQMSTASEKQKLMALVDAGSATASAAADGADSVTNEAVAMSREMLRRAKYVKRKVQRVRKVVTVVPTTIVDEEHKEDEEIHAPERIEETSCPTETMDVDEETNTTTTEADETKTGDDPLPTVVDAVKEADETRAVGATTGPEESAAIDLNTSADAEAVKKIPSPPDGDPTDKQIEENVRDAIAMDDSRHHDQQSKAVVESCEGEEATAPSDDGNSNPETTETQVSLDVDGEDKEVAELHTGAIAVAPPEVEEDTIVEDVWEFCLALKPLASAGRTTTVEASEPQWRLVPLDSDSGEFVADVFLTDEEVNAIEVTEAEVCGESKPRLAGLHRHELALRDKVKSEQERRQALEGVIKIEQERLGQVFIVYRRMLEGIMTKSSDVQKKHQRITRELLLVDLMKQAFAPILDDLLTQCESVFLQQLEKLADRYEDFQQEFEYYTDALVSVAGTKEPPNGHMKGEEEREEPNSMELDGGSAVEDDDESSTGLRGAYVSFYMEEIEALWKERCRACESLFAMLRSLTSSTPTDGESEAVVDGGVVDQPDASLLRRRVMENLDQWKTVDWPAQLATPSFVSSFMLDSSLRGAAAVTRHPTPSNAMKTEHDNMESLGVSAMGELKQIIIDLTQETPTTVPSSRVVRHSTLVVYHPVFLDHQTPKDHPECPERLNRIITMLSTLRKKFDDILRIDRLTQSAEDLSPSESILLAVHSPAYLEQLKTRSIEASSSSATGGARGSLSFPPSALVFETNRGVTNLSATGASSSTRASPTSSMGGAFGADKMQPTGIAMDTYVSSKSWDVARAAAGTVCLAVDRVVRKEFRNAACLVRPPGHHVGRHGRTLDAPSSGFCLLNNVVIGAVHARQYPWIRRVAVLDWDIHHGNGTEELMRDDPDGFFASIHLYASGKFFPGTGKSEQQDNLVNVALENTGAGSGSTVFRSALQEQILPAMRAFRPDIIFISAGFDGHKDDILGGRAAVKNAAVPAGYLEEDYAWATQEVLKVADECCDGRVISVLEGGYDVRKETNSLAKSVAAHVSAIASYEQDKEKQRASDEEATTVSTDSKSADIRGILGSLLAKDMGDDDVIIIDDDDDDDDDDEKALGRLGGEDDDEEDEDIVDEDIDDDGVEVDEEEDGHDDRDHDHDGDDVVMTDEDHDGEDSVDGEDDADSQSMSFTASLNVEEDEEEESHHVSRIDTPENGGTARDADGDEDMMRDHGDDVGDGDMVTLS